MSVDLVLQLAHLLLHHLRHALPFQMQQEEQQHELQHALQNAVRNLTEKPQWKFKWQAVQVRTPRRGRSGYCTLAALTTARTQHISPTRLANTLAQALREELQQLHQWNIVAEQNGYVNMYRIVSEEEKKSLETKEYSQQTDEGFRITQMGIVRSCFKEKYGTPRQGALVPHGKAKIVFRQEIRPESMQGLCDFSHVWVIFIFHANGPASFKSKIKPPKLNGKKIGVFSTRAPHRWNDIGLSVAKIEGVRVENGLVVLDLSAIDLIDGTPVIDLKPYHFGDCVNNALVPEWVKLSVQNLMSVIFHEQALEELTIAVQQGLEFYDDVAEVQSAIEECLANDPRTIHSKSKHNIDSALYGFAFDRLDITYRINSSEEAQVFHVAYISEESDRSPLRTKEWFEYMQCLLSERM